MNIYVTARLRGWAARLPRFRRETPEMKRFREVCEMRDLGIAMYRQRMRNENPKASRKQISAMVQAWLLEPPRKSFLSPPPGRSAGRPHRNAKKSRPGPSEEEPGRLKGPTESGG